MEEADYRLLESVASRIKRRYQQQLRAVTLDDLISLGWIGLSQAPDDALLHQKTARIFARTIDGLRDEGYMTRPECCGKATTWSRTTTGDDTREIEFEFSSTKYSKLEGEEKDSSRMPALDAMETMHLLCQALTQEETDIAIGIFLDGLTAHEYADLKKEEPDRIILILKVRIIPEIRKAAKTYLDLDEGKLNLKKYQWMFSRKN